MSSLCVTSLYCSKCSAPQPMNISSFKRDEIGPNGEIKVVESITYHCAICFSFVRREDHVQDDKPPADQAA